MDSLSTRCGDYLCELRKTLRLYSCRLLSKQSSKEPLYVFFCYAESVSVYSLVHEKNHNSQSDFDLHGKKCDSIHDFY